MTRSTGSHDSDWDRLEAALADALSLAAGERDGFVTDLETTDPELASEVRALLAHVDSGQTWFRGAADWLRPAPLESSESDTDADDRIVGSTVGKYRISRRLGGGGMGVVYEARDVRLGRLVALKFLPPALSADSRAKARLLREAQAVAGLDHPNVCTLYEIGESDDGRLFLAMAYYEGRTLKSLLANESGLKPERAADLAIQIARALSVAHAAGIVHRDVKPANVMITQAGVVKLLDFGIALREAGSRLGKARPAGTLAYMAPEQLAGKALDKRSDLWALGVVLWEMLAGARPFRGGNTVELIDAIEFDRPEMAVLEESPEVEPLARLARRLLAKDVTDRPDGAAEVVSTLLDYLRTSPSNGGRGGGTTAVGTSDEHVAADVVRALDDTDSTWSRTGIFRVLQRRTTRAAALFAVVVWTAVSVVGGLSRSGAEPSVTTQRFPIPAIDLVGIWSWIDLSDDGTRLAYSAPPGQPLGIRELDTGADRPLAGTENGHSPFFSPDGTSVGFRRGNRLLAASATTGRVSTLVEDLPFFPAGLTWVDDSTLVAGRLGTGLVSLHLGEPGVTARIERLTSAPAMGHAQHVAPRRIPGQRAVVFEVRHPDSLYSVGIVDLADDRAEHRVRVIDRRGRSPRVVDDQVVLAYFRDLHAFSIDPVTLEATSPSRSLGLAVNGRTQEIDFAVGSNGRVAYVSPHAFHSRLVSLTRSGSPRVVSREWDAFLAPRFSPDGTRLAYTTQQQAIPLQKMWTLDLVTGSLSGYPRQGLAGRPRWSEGGDSLAFIGQGVDGPSVLKRAADGTGTETFILAGGIQDLSRDGDWLIYGDPSGDFRARHLREGTDIPLMGNPGRTRFALAPDAGHVAYSMEVDGVDRVFVRTFPEFGPPLGVSGGFGFDPRWSADGSELFFRDGRSLVAVKLETAPTLRVRSREGLFRDDYRLLAGYDVNPTDGSFVFVQARADSATVVVQSLPVPTGDADSGLGH